MKQKKRDKEAEKRADRPEIETKLEPTQSPWKSGIKEDHAGHEYHTESTIQISAIL